MTRSHVHARSTPGLTATPRRQRSAVGMYSVHIHTCISTMNERVDGPIFRKIIFLEFGIFERKNTRPIEPPEVLGIQTSHLGRALTLARTSTPEIRYISIPHHQCHDDRRCGVPSYRVNFGFAGKKNKNRVVSYFWICVGGKSRFRACPAVHIAASIARTQLPSLRLGDCTVCIILYLW